MKPTPTYHQSANDRLEILRKREQSVRAAIAAEKIRRLKRAEREAEHLYSVVGKQLVLNASKHPDFDLLLRGILKTSTSFTEGEKKLLRAKGWL